MPMLLLPPPLLGLRRLPLSGLLVDLLPNRLLAVVHLVVPAAPRWRCLVGLAVVEVLLLAVVAVPLSASHPSTVAPSFSQVVLSSLAPLVLPLSVHAPATTDSGEPATFFSLEEVQLSCQPLAFAVIARTPKGRPPFHEIRAHLAQRFHFKQDFLLNAMDKRHLLLCFSNRDDYLQVLLKDSMLDQGQPFWFFQWSLDFSP